MTSRYDRLIQREIQVTRLSPEDYNKYRRARGAAIASGLIALLSFWIMYGVCWILPSSWFGTRGLGMITTLMLSIPLAIFAMAASSLFKSQARKIRETATEPLLTSKNKEEASDE